MDVNTFANSLEQIDNVEDLYICVECVLPKNFGAFTTLLTAPAAVLFNPVQTQ
jgi:hypothetical protein